jgi:hypothetical protein
MPKRHKDDANRDIDEVDYVADQAENDYLERKYAQEEDTEQFRTGNRYESGEKIYWEKLDVAEREFEDDLSR